MNVYLTTAKRAVIYAYPAILSLFEHNQASEIYLYIVSEDLEEADIKEELKLAQQYGNHIVILHFDEDMAKGRIVCGSAEHWPLGTLGCYWLFHELLPAEVERIMAIESDTIVVGDLSEFYRMELGGCCAACPDPEHKPASHRKIMEDLQGDVLTFVVSLYDVNAIRRDFTLEDILNADAAAVRRFGHSQQELTFGLLFKDRICFVPAQSLCVEENRQSMEALGYEYLLQCHQTCKVLHFSSFTDRGKPWNPVCVMPGYGVWWKYAEKSPYYREYFEEQWKAYDKKDGEIRELEKNRTCRNLLLMTLLLFTGSLFAASLLTGRSWAGSMIIAAALCLSAAGAQAVRYLSIWSMKRRSKKERSKR